MRPDDPERLDPDLDPDDEPGEDLEASIELADHAFGAESFGTTAEEQLRGESLDQRLETHARRVAAEPFFRAGSFRDRAPGGVDHEDDYVEE